MAIRCSVRLLLRTAPLAACLLVIWSSALYHAVASGKPPRVAVATAAAPGASGMRSTRHEASVSLLSPSVDLDSLLANPVALSPVAEEETLQCVDYSGPCFFMNHPTGQAPLHSVPGAKLQPSTHDSCASSRAMGVGLKLRRS